MTESKTVAFIIRNGVIVLATETGDDFATALTERGDIEDAVARVVANTPVTSKINEEKT